MRPRRSATAAVLTTALATVAATAGTAFAATGPYTVTTVSGAYLKNGSIGSTILRWNPCVTLHWAVNTAGAPKNFVAEARRAVTEMAHATGENWSYAGTTSIRPTLDSGNALIGGPLQAKNLQLVIAWDSRSSSNSVLKLQNGESGETVYLQAGGESGQDTTTTVTPTQLTQVAIVLDKTKAKFLASNDKKGNGLYRLLLHELGHAAGLQHVHDGKQIMNPVGTPTSAVHYQAGDKTGLQKVGHDAGCLNNVTVSA